MASQDYTLNTWYAKRIIGDASAASSIDALLQAGVNGNIWIFGSNRASVYGIKYLYDSSTNHDKIELYGGYQENSINTPTAWVQLDTGDVYIKGKLGINAEATAQLTVTGPNSGSVPLVKLNPSGTSTWQRGVQMLNSGMVQGNELMYCVGQADSAKNMGQMYFYFDSAGSNNNRLSFGLHSVDDALNILGSGNIGVGTTSPDAKLAINGDIRIGVRGTTSGPSSITYSNRITIVPYFHTGGPWYIKSGDDASNAYLALYYNTTELMRIKHDGTQMVDWKGNAATADKWKTKRSITIGGTAHDVDGSGNVSWTKAEILGSSTNANFYRGDQTWSNTLNGAFTANGTITANGGYLKSTLNSNTVTIGSANTGFCHIQNSADIPFWFNKNIYLEQGKTIGAAGTQYRPFQLYLGRYSTTAGNALNTANPLIEFSNSDRSQYCQLMYDDHDSLVAPDSLTLVGNQNGIFFICKNGPIWVQGGSNAGGNQNRLTTTSGMPGNMQYNVSRRGTQIYSNGIAFCDPYNGNSNSDASWIRHQETTSNTGELEIAVGDDGDETIVVRQYKTDNTVKRTLTLLSKDGYTFIPSYLNIGGHEKNASSPTYVWGSNSSDNYLRSYQTSKLSVATAASCSGNAATATRINGNLAAATSDVNRNIWVSSTAGADGIPNYISYFNMNPSTKVFTVPAGTRISPNAGALYIGNSGNQSWVYIQDMCSQSGNDKWKITQAGAAVFSGGVTANVTGNCSGSSGSCTGNAASATYASSYLANRGGVSGSSHAAALQAYFNSNKSSEPRNCLVAHYSSAYSNGSMCFGYFLNGYDSAPYGGFFVCHYNTPRYVGIQGGTYSEWALAREGTAVSFTNVYASRLYSPGGQYYACMQNDGNFVIYNSGGTAQWSTKYGKHVSGY